MFEIFFGYILAIMILFGLGWILSILAQKTKNDTLRNLAEYTGIGIFACMPMAVFVGVVHIIIHIIHTTFF